MEFFGVFVMLMCVLFLVGVILTGISRAVNTISDYSRELKDILVEIRDQLKELNNKEKS